MPTPNEDNFEEQWRDAFEDAELEPSPVVWAGLEPHLPKSAGAAWLRYGGLGVLGLSLLVGSIYFLNGDDRENTRVHSPQTTEERQNTRVHSPQTTDDRQNTRVHSPQTIDDSLNTNLKFDNNKNSQNIDNQLVTKLQTTDERQNTRVHSPQTIDHRQNSNTKFDNNKNTQNTDNQLVTKLQTTDHRPQTIDHRQNSNTKFDNNKNTQNIDNQVVIKKQITVHSPQTTDHSQNTNTKFDNNKNSQGVDNQVVIKKQAIDERPQTTGNSQNSNLKFDNNKNPQNIDNQVVIEKRQFIAVNLLPSKTIKVDNPLIKRDLLEHNFASQTLAQKPVRQRFAVSVGLMPNVFQPKVSANYSDYLNTYLQTHQQTNVDASNFFRGLREQNQTEMSYSIQLYFSYALSPKWQARTGLQYLYDRNRLITNAFFVNQGNGETVSFLQNMVSGNLSNPNFVQAIHNHPTYKPGAINAIELTNFNDAQTIQIKNEFHYLSIPIQMGYNLLNTRRFNFTTWAGVGMDIFLKNTAQSQDLTHNSQRFTSQNSGYRRVNWSGLLNFSIQYRYNAHWSWVAEPSYRFALQTYSQTNTMLQFRPRNWGVNLGVQYRF
jgi:hypothetical protein